MEPNRRNNTPEKKKIEPAINKIPEVRTPSRTQQFWGNFLASDIESVKEYVIMDVFLPRLKNTALAMLNSAAEMLIMGTKTKKYSDHNNYSSYSRDRVTTYTRESRPASRPTTAYVPYPEPLFETEDDAFDVIDMMKDYISEYPYVSISDFLGFANRPSDDEYTYPNYGWSAEVIRNCIPEQIPDGRFIVKLPRPRYIR